MSAGSYAHSFEDFFDENVAKSKNHCIFANSWSRTTERKTNGLSRREGRAIGYDTPRDNRMSLSFLGGFFNGSFVKRNECQALVATNSNFLYVNIFVTYRLAVNDGLQSMLFRPMV